MEHWLDARLLKILFVAEIFSYRLKKLLRRKILLILKNLNTKVSLINQLNFIII